MRYIFDLNEVVEVVNDYRTNGKFIGVKGVIQDVVVNNDNDTVYGLKIIEGNEYIDKDLLSGDLLYFLALEIQ